MNVAEEGGGGGGEGRRWRRGRCECPRGCELVIYKLVARITFCRCAYTSDLILLNIVSSILFTLLSGGTIVQNHCNLNYLEPIEFFRMESSHTTLVRFNYLYIYNFLSTREGEE